MDTIVNNKAFILVEIILSIVLLSIVGTALFKVSTNQKNIYIIANKKVEFSRYVSILVNRHSSDLHNKDINLYENIKKEYDIKNSGLIKVLKDTKIHYIQNNRSLLNFNNTNETNGIHILIDEIRVSDKKGSSNYISVKM